MSYILRVDIDLDDDGRLVYDGKTYCRYEPDLSIEKELATVEEAYIFLRTAIQEEPGHKLPVGWLSAIIEEFIQCHKRDDDSWSGDYGNQTVDITLMEKLPASAPSLEDTATLHARATEMMAALEQAVVLLLETPMGGTRARKLAAWASAARDRLNAIKGEQNEQ